MEETDIVTFARRQRTQLMELLQEPRSRLLPLPVRIWLERQAVLTEEIAKVAARG